MEKGKQQIDTENIAPRYIKKDGTLAPLKKDGSLRLVGGGYSTKQEKWGRRVLRNATNVAEELFGSFSLMVIAHYLRYDCGYEGATHLFIKRVKGFKAYNLLVEAFDNMPHKGKYLTFRERVYELNLEWIEKHRKKKRPPKDGDDC